jgi:hypothetical protein
MDSMVIDGARTGNHASTYVFLFGSLREKTHDRLLPKSGVIDFIEAWD